VAATRAEKGRSRLITDRWGRIESLCHAALARPAQERAGYLAEACRGDEALRKDVESLVAEADAAGSFLELPVFGGAVSASFVGRQLGPYRIEAPIGAGGMGEVYHAKDTRLDRNVAIKVLPPQWTADPQRRTRFEREARAVAALKHPNICTIYDVGHDDGIDFLVMELVAGESLAARLSRGPLPYDEAVGRAIEIASALDEAHSHGIIHRDLKPSNVMLTRSGFGTSRGEQAKLLDFGLARIISSDMTAQLSSGPHTPMTEAGGLFGTVEYMAPEQIQGAPTDGRTDLFAFGALLYEMLTGRMAFARATKAESLTAVLRDHPDQTVLERSGAASSVIRIVRRCLEKDPADRFQTARDLAFALENAASPDKPETRSAEEGTIARARRIPRRQAIYIMSAMTALAAVAVWTVGGRDVAPPNRDINRFTWSLPEGMTLGSEPVVSPDGRRVVFVGVGQSDSPLFVRDLATLEAVSLPGTTGAKQPFWSPDGRAIAFFANGRLMKVPLEGGEPVDLAAAPDARGGSWSRSGVIVFQPFFRDRGLARVSANGGEVQAATLLDVTTDDTTHKWPVFLPDGDHFLYLVLSVDESRRGIYVGSLSQEPSRPTTRLFPTGSSVSYVVPEGHDTGFVLSVAGGQIQARPFDGDRRTVTGDPRSIGIAAAETSVHYAAMMGVSPRLLAFADTVVPAGSQFASVGVDGKQLTLRPDREIAGPPRLSLDGARVTRSVLDPLTGDADIWIDDLVRDTRVRISTSRDLDLAPVWSPDGRQVAYRSGPWGTSNLSIASADGTGVPRVLRCPGEPCLPTDWSPDGRFIFVNVRGDVWTVQIIGEGSAQPWLDATSVQRDARISPDGRRISYVSHESGRPEVYVQNLAGPPDRIVVSRGGDQPVWSRHGRELFYVSLDNELHRVAIGTDRNDRVIVEPPTKLPLPTFARGHLGTSYDVSPDAARVYFAHPGAPSKPRELGFALEWAARLK
jgi:serine/threonine protein kinase/Tol biopolymer transport system component